MINQVKWTQIAVRKKISIFLSDDIDYNLITDIINKISDKPDLINQLIVSDITNKMKKCLDT